jgi:hypothetical protein
MVARTLLTAIAVGLSAGLLAEPAARAEAERVQKAAAVEIVDAQLFRSEIEGYVRELDRQMRVKLNEDLRRELGPKVVLAVNELRTRS